jgi:hypothetical protein
MGRYRPSGGIYSNPRTSLPLVSAATWGIGMYLPTYLPVPRDFSAAAFFVIPTLRRKYANAVPPRPKVGSRSVLGLVIMAHRRMKVGDLPSDRPLS